MLILNKTVFNHFNKNWHKTRHRKVTGFGIVNQKNEQDCGGQCSAVLYFLEAVGYFTSSSAMWITFSQVCSQVKVLHSRS